MTMQHQFINDGEAAVLPGRPGVLYEERTGAKRMYRWVNGAMVEVGAGSGGSSGGGSGGGGSDRSAVVTEADPVNGGKRVLRETVDGIPWDFTYDGQGRLSSRVWASGGLTATITYDADGFGTASGNIFRDGGVIQTTASQMAALKTGLIALALSGVAPKFYVSDFDLNVGWDAARNGFRGVGGRCVINAQLTGATINDPSTVDNTIFSATIPGWMRSAGSTYIVSWWASTPNGAIVKSHKTTINGTLVANVGSGAAATLFYQSACVVKELSAGVISAGSAGSAVGDITNTSLGNSALITTSPAAGTDVSVVVATTYASGPGAGTNCTGFDFLLEHKLG